MGKVVKLDPGATDRPASARETAAPRRRRQRSKTALLLGGGGFTAAVYEIGALRALDLLSRKRMANGLVVYDRTSLAACVPLDAAHRATRDVQKVRIFLIATTPV